LKRNKLKHTCNALLSTIQLTRKKVIYFSRSIYPHFYIKCTNYHLHLTVNYIKVLYQINQITIPIAYLIHIIILWTN